MSLLDRDIFVCIIYVCAEKLNIRPQDRSKFFGVGGRNLRKLRSETGKLLIDLSYTF